MSIIRPSDTAINSLDYDGGIGHYTNMTKICDLLGIAPFTTDTIPTLANIGELIRYAEDYIDEYTKQSWRPSIIEDEMKDFDLDFNRMYRYNSATSRYTDYVGFVRLNREDVRKVIRLCAWKGDVWEELAGATCKVNITDFTSITNVVLQLPNSGETFTLLTHPNNAGCFNNQFGNNTTAQELVYLINEQAPANTRDFTGQNGKKSFQGSAGSNISKFFYASLEDDNSIVISSLLPSDDGKNCTITVNGSGITKEDFKDNENIGRDNDWWIDNATGTVFFKSTYPLQVKHSLRCTYQTGKQTVPAVITEAATKLVCCELMSSDDNTILLGENQQSGLDIKTKFDTYRADVEKILNMKKRLIYLIDSD
tara:strand:- start:3315 stop:4415 length:1101 start_codon:yes stop_codon:yes gene_type:complete